MEVSYHTNSQTNLTNMPNNPPLNTVYNATTMVSPAIPTMVSGPAIAAAALPGGATSVGGSVAQMQNPHQNLSKAQKKANKIAKQSAFYLKHYESWAARFLYNFLNYLNRSEMIYFFGDDSMLTYFGSNNSLFNCQGGMAIATHLCTQDQTSTTNPKTVGVFGNMKQVHLRNHQAQPTDDRSGILIVAKLDVEKVDGSYSKVDMTMVLKKYPGKKEERPRLPNYAGVDPVYAKDGNYTICQYAYNIICSVNS